MKTLIIGGGLSGLALAEMLEAQGEDYCLVEARDRFGGRIKTAQIGGGAFDLGPAWFWPGQPRIADLIARLGLAQFDQFAAGVLTFEDEFGQVQRGRGYASMEGSLRLQGGLARLTGALADRLPPARKRLGAPVCHIAKIEDGIAATLKDGSRLHARHVVLAMPTRIAAEIRFDPELPPSARDAMQAVPTWMAGQAKAIAIYDHPFWREEGLSGDAMSRRGPMVEIHDASPASGGPYALFGFTGVPPQIRIDQDMLTDQVITQLVRLFGPRAGAPSQVIIKDWAIDPWTATEADQAPLFAHPTYGMPAVLQELWNGRLHFAGTEVAAQFGGYLEGALEAAEHRFAELQSGKVTSR